MNVEISHDPSRWDSYVASMPEASSHHRWGWRYAIEETFGHKAYYLSAVDNDHIKGILPLVHIKSRFFGNSLVSLPFFSYGGVLASTSCAATSLIDAAERLAVDVGAQHIEMRQGNKFSTTWTDRAPKVTMEVELPGTVQELSDRLSSKMRKRIRFARKNGIEPRWGGPEALTDFYPVFATNMRNLGTPVYPRSWFENICRKFPDGIRILTLVEHARPIASAFVSIFRETVELPWAATLPESRDKFSPLLMYWTLLEWSLENGYKRVDLGRCTPGGGNHDFKKRWVCQEKPLHWYYWLASGATVPGLRPDNPRYRMATHIWKHLPLTVANLLGPRIVRCIP